MTPDIHDSDTQAWERDLRGWSAVQERIDREETEAERRGDIERDEGN